jgi:hypothetical protein
MKKLIVILAVITMVGAFAATTMAAEWSFYGHSRMTTFSYDRSKDLVGTNYDDQDTTWTSQTNARFGAKVKASDTVSGQFEQAMSSNSFALRLMFGEWNFGAGSLLVGQDYTPVDTIISASAGVLPSVIAAAGTNPILDGEGNALQIGSFYESRIAQIKLKFGDFQLAFVQPSTTGTQGVYTDIDTILPKIELNYTFKTDMFSVTPYGGYQSVDFTNPATDSSVSITSYVYGVTAGVNFGPAYVKGNIFGGTNTGNFGRSNVVNYDTAVITGTDSNDADTWGGIILLGYKLNDMLTFEAGYARDHSENDYSGANHENETTQWYVNATVTLAPGVFIVPEVGNFDFGDNKVAGVSTKNGDVTYFGAKWQINF